MSKPFVLSAAAAACVALSAALIAAPAQAGVLFAFEEVNGDVVGTLSGSLDVSGVSDTGVFDRFLGEGIAPNLAQVASSGGVTAFVDTFAVMGPASLGSGGPTFASVSSGDAFLLSGGFTDGIVLALPDGYSGADLSGTLSFAGATLQGLGITPGDYVYTLVEDIPGLPPSQESLFAASAAAPANTITLRFTPGEAAVIPLPAGLPLLLAGLGALALLRRKRG